MSDQIPLIDEEYSRELSQWYTPRQLAERTVEWAFDVEGLIRPLRVLEPSAGLGALLRPIPRRHTIIAYELDERRCVQLGAIEGVQEVRHADFLGHDPAERFDLAIMNPPYEGGADLDHLLHAALCCNRVVAILRICTLSGVALWEKLWSQVGIHRIAICERRPRFDGPVSFNPSGGTMVVDLSLSMESYGIGQPRTTRMEWW